MLSRTRKAVAVALLGAVALLSAAGGAYELATHTAHHHSVSAGGGDHWPV